MHSSKIRREVARQIDLDQLRQDEERALEVKVHHQQNEGAQVVHRLAVSDPRIVDAVRAEHCLERLDSSVGIDQPMARKGSMEVGCNLVGEYGAGALELPRHSMELACFCFQALVGSREYKPCLIHLARIRFNSSIDHD